MKIFIFSRMEIHIDDVRVELCECRVESFEILKVFRVEIQSAPAELVHRTRFLLPLSLFPLASCQHFNLIYDRRMKKMRWANCKQFILRRDLSAPLSSADDEEMEKIWNVWMGRWCWCGVNELKRIWIISLFFFISIFNIHHTSLLARRRSFNDDVDDIWSC